MFRSIVVEDENKIKKEIKDLKKNINKLEEKIDIIIQILQKDVKNNCEKMGEHIDFVEKVYDNVKNPLGFLCNKINYFNNNNKNFDLLEDNSDFSSDEENEENDTN